MSREWKVHLRNQENNWHVLLTVKHNIMKEKYAKKAVTNTRSNNRFA